MSRQNKNEDEVVFVEAGEGKGSRRRVSVAAVVVLMVLLFGVLMLCMSVRGVTWLEHYEMFAMGVDVTLVVVSFVIFLCCTSDPGFYSDETDEPLYFICLWIVNYVASLADALTMISDRFSPLSSVLYISSTIGFFLSPMLIILIWYYLRTQLKLNEKYEKAATIAINILALIADLNAIANVLFSHLFYVDSYGVYHDGPLSYTPFIIAFLMLLLITVSVLISGEKIRRKLALTALLMLLVPAALFTGNTDYFVIGIASTVILMCLYGLMYARRGETIAKRDSEIESRKTAVLSAQIKPHFINNLMQVIMNLQEEDPPKALEAMGVFSTYVRDSMENINNADLVPFIQEMEFADKYLYLQELRFANRFKVEKDIRVEDFEIPAFTVQPLVENAVKYGFAGNKETGNIFIGTKRTDTGYRIIISDDGNGFDESKISKDRVHVGLYNVQERVRRLTGGEVFIDSVIGRGTRIVIDIPFNEADWRSDKNE